MEVDWANDTMVDGDLGWCSVARMMFRFYTIWHERAMQDFEIQATIDCELAVEQEAAELQVHVAVCAVDGNLALNRRAHAVCGLDNKICVSG